MGNQDPPDSERRGDVILDSAEQIQRGDRGQAVLPLVLVGEPDLGVEVEDWVVEPVQGSAGANNYPLATASSSRHQDPFLRACLSGHFVDGSFEI